MYKLRKLFIIWSVVTVLMIISGVAYLKISYLYLPFEYKKSEVIPLKWSELKNPIRVEYCYFEGSKWYCHFSMDKSEIKDFFKHFENVHYATTTEEGYKALDQNPWSMFDDKRRYHIMLREITGKDEYGNLEGYYLFSLDIFGDQNYISAYGKPYYYSYELTDDLKDFLFNQDYEEYKG